MRIQQHSAYPHSRFRWAKFLGTCCTMAARHRSDTTQCRTAGKLATWTLEVSVWKMERHERETSEKRSAQTAGHALPRLQWEEEMERYKESAFQWVVGSVVSSFFFYLNPISVKNQEGHHFQPAQATKHTFYSECVEINMETLCTMNPIIA